MAEYIDLDEKIVVSDTRGREIETTVRHILEMNKGSYTAADVRPVARGKWTNKRTIEHDGEWYCTACGKEITIYMGADREDRYNFCPNCGADMGEES